jgi:hypothetical protein
MLSMILFLCYFVSIAAMLATQFPPGFVLTENDIKVNDFWLGSKDFRGGLHHLSDEFCSDKCGMVLVLLERPPLLVSCCSTVEVKIFLEHDVRRMYAIATKYRNWWKQLPSCAWGTA